MASAGAPIAGIDSILLQKQLFGQVQFGAFDNGVTRISGGGPSDALSFNGFDSFILDADVIDQPGHPEDGTAFGGIGGHYLGEFGATFDITNYQLELTYKLGPNNVADKLDVVMTQHDGGTDGEEYTFRFTDIDTLGNTSTFTTLTRELDGLTSDGYDSPAGPPQFTTFGNALQDYDATKGGTPNGLYEIEIQSIFGTTLRTNVEIQSLKLVPKAVVAEPEVARLDGNSGTTFGYGPLNNAVSRTGNILHIDATDPFGGQVGGTAIETVRTPFDGTAKAVEVTAKLGPNNTSNNIAVILKETDGNDDAAGQGAEEWGYFYNTNNSNFFNANEFTTISIPVSDGTFIQTPSNFTNSGDGSTDDFDLYQMQVFSFFANAGTVLDIDIQSVKIVDFVDSADFDFDGDRDGADFLEWQRNAVNSSGSAFLTNGDANNDGNIDSLDFAVWESQFGVAPPLSAVSTLSAAVPEPNSLLLLALGLSCLAGGRSSRKNFG